MPRTNLSRVPRDPLKELVLGRQRALKLTNTELADKLHISRPKLHNMCEAHSNTWRIGELLNMASALDIPIDELRGLIGRR